MCLAGENVVTKQATHGDEVRNVHSAVAVKFRGSGVVSRLGHLLELHRLC